MKQQVEDFLIEMALKIARDKKGCLLIMKEGELNYELQLENDIKSFNVLENGRRLEPLALQPGACLIGLDGNLISYGVRILDIKPYPNYGFRHAAAYTSSLTGNTTILASDDDLKVRVFKNGELVAQLDPFEKGIEKNIPKITDVLENEFFKSTGAGTIGYLGAATLIPALGITFIPGVILFGSLYYLTKIAREKGLAK